ncbi:hypothetical protein OSB04_003206 [Centaurea solstitialis]|uniref:Uncharacterized protein n=1 Tax=Centaurea solstitialis TaxID=347529 RepID=A0AA38TUE8_9ASTR|nr:hypothetical protein OSB04_003206 [Centaurea solstitialis]
MTTPTASHKEATVAGPWLDRRSPIVAVNAHQFHQRCRGQWELRKKSSGVLTNMLRPVGATQEIFWSPDEHAKASGSYAFFRKNKSLLIANTVTNTNLSLRSILEKDKLTESNFSRLEAQSDDCTHAREKVEKAPPAKATVTVRNAYRKHSDYLLDVGYLMLATMSPDFRMRLINTNAYNMIRQLRDMSQTQARTERYDASRTLNACKMAKGTSRHIDHLEKLGRPVSLQLATYTIINSLSEDYK